MIDEEKIKMRKQAHAAQTNAWRMAHLEWYSAYMRSYRKKKKLSVGNIRREGKKEN